MSSARPSSPSSASRRALASMTSLTSLTSRASTMFALALAHVLSIASPALADDAPKKPRAHDDAPAVTSKTKRPKKTKQARKTIAKAAAKPCVGTSVALDRIGREPQELRLVDCHRAPVESSRVALSVLARPWGAPKPERPLAVGRSSSPRKGRGADEIAPGVRLLDKGLLVRVDAIAHHFGGKPVSLVSGYRPQSQGSQHQVGRALDLRVAGVSNEQLVAYCKTLKDTGCGYYPNSSFVHVDVRNPGTGTVTWIDASGPGEGPRYVPSWPPRADDESHPAQPAPKGKDGKDDAPDPWDELGDPSPSVG